MYIVYQAGPGNAISLLQKVYQAGSDNVISMI